MPKSSNIRTGRTFLHCVPSWIIRRGRLTGINFLIRKINIKTNTLVNARHFVLKSCVSFKAADNRTLKTGYIINFSKKYVSILHWDDVFDEGADVKKMVSAKVNHICPFVGEVEEMVDNFNWVNSRVGI